MTLTTLKIVYDDNFKTFITDILTNPHKISIQKILNLCGILYKHYFNEKKDTPSIEILSNYSYKFSYSKKFVIISSNVNFDFKTNKSFINYNLSNNSDYKHYCFDKDNNIFYSENCFYFLKDLLFSNKIVDKRKQFLNFIDIFILYYEEEQNSFYVSTNPEIEDIFTNDFIQKTIIEESFFIKNVRIPKWLYCDRPENLVIDKYILLLNADIKAEFIKKAGIEKLLSFGIVVDTYENYPDNEWWAKSEYKLVDMHKVIPPIKAFTVSGKQIILESWEYAPFLHMKNQTTGVIHLEGVNPKCLNLYDALKMRYKGLNLPKFEIKDIK